MKKSSPKNAKSAPARAGAKSTKEASAKNGNGKQDHWNLRLYVAGQTPKSLTAFTNLKRLCDEHLTGRYSIEVIDLAKQPHLAINDQIVALPTLVRKLPEPIKRIVGDLSNTERVVVGMELRTISAERNE